MAYLEIELNEKLAHFLVHIAAPIYIYWVAIMNTAFGFLLYMDVHNFMDV